MKMETAKTLVLVVLIGISLLLTFGIWSYQPELPQLNNNALNESVDIGGKNNETKSTLIEPREIVFRAEDHYYGFVDPKMREPLYKQIQNWQLVNFQTDLVNERTPNKYEVEIIFPSELPMEILKNIMNFSDSTIELPSWSFERMYLTFDSDTKSLNVEILSIDGRNEATAVINDPSNYEFLWKYFESNDDELLQDYLAVELAGKNVYLPMDAKKLKRQSYTYVSIDVQNTLNRILFQNPSLVSRTYSSEPKETYYTDSQRGMRIYGDSGARMVFVDPYSEDQTSDDQTIADMLTYSINNINDHSGWTDEYNLMDIDGKENRVRYQMYNQGYPVYNEMDLSYIDQKWINLRLNEYSRPLFSLRDQLNSNTVELMSGEGLIAYLADNLENIQDIRIGYRLNYHSDENDLDDDSLKNRVIELIPGWFKLENGEWNEIILSEDKMLKGGA